MTEIAKPHALDTAADVARAHGIGLETIRKWEELGLFAAERRAPGPVRFGPYQRDRLVFIIRLHKAGLDPTVIRKILETAPRRRREQAVAALQNHLVASQLAWAEIIDTTQSLLASLEVELAALSDDEIERA